MAHILYSDAVDIPYPEETINPQFFDGKHSVQSSALSIGTIILIIVVVIIVASIAALLIKRTLNKKRVNSDA